jgi:hypothetical protein
MPNKLTFNDVKQTIETTGCKLLEKKYENNKTPLKIKCSNYEKCKTVFYASLSKFKYYKYTSCEECRKDELNKQSSGLMSSYFKTNKNGMHPKTYTKIKRVMERKYEMTKKYRSDFYDENYNRKLTCWDCKETKPMRLFPYRKQYKDNKEKRCKQCNNMNNAFRKEKFTQEQYIQNLITSSKRSAIKREKRGRPSCGECNMTVSMIQNIAKKQNNKCVYSGYDLEWKINSKNKASIDRIDSTKGYIEGNLQLVTYNVNTAKSNMSDAEFKTLIQDCYHNLFAK